MPIDLSPENQERVRAAAAENRARGGWGPPVGGPIILDDAEQVQEARVDYREVLHPRGRTGEWVKKPLTAARKAEAKAETVEPKDWTDPPPPVGKKGETKGGKGYSSDKAFGTNTALGHVGEDAFVRILGGTILHPEGKGAQSPLDVHYDGYAFEVKAVSTRSLAYKATPKPFEIEQKEAHAQELGVKAALAIVVIDSENGRAHAYYREGLKSGRLSKNTGWQYLGSTDLPSTKLDRRPTTARRCILVGAPGAGFTSSATVKADQGPTNWKRSRASPSSTWAASTAARARSRRTPGCTPTTRSRCAHAIEGELQRRRKPLGQSLSHDDLDARFRMAPRGSRPTSVASRAALSQDRLPDRGRAKH